ncbi:major facilitator superfamily MFS 1 protein [Halorhabdus tiamatea SARL4B]|uniref:Major facilitator superfamily MFS 1 protein n=1 Tax=Halorhabdus tiamatea SARL4B TaxID=1033806 RepID=F7PKP0_9EURY|nr:MFS transporter [Halorhabdus tiamatea]ERJ04554.1 major facilitator superfamily MFS 1 protein [Halorhabdus tiamatea SARL4B]ERJ06196.1 major facilitator superfamily MFS 1 protein [Halorhabdus tiamatea SARL4B]CCQ34026.1 major facilitator superfamily MFS_1 protein [Halorhabdus tiamatea SARL4B]
MSDEDVRRDWIVVLFAFVAIDGALIQARGALVPVFGDVFTVGESYLGLVTPVGTVGFVLAMVVFGTASGRIDIKRFLAISVAATIASVLVLGLSPTYLLLLAFIGIRSFSTGIFRSLDRSVLSHLYPNSRARVLSLHTMVWAVGATLGPLLVTAVMWEFPWRVTYLVLAIALVPVLVALWRLDRPESLDDEQSLALDDVKILLREPAIYGMAIALVFVGSMESVFFNWLPYYAEGLFSENIANLTLSIYLAAYVPGRLTFSYLAERYRFTDLLVGVGVVLVVTMYAALVLASGTGLLALVFVIGFFISGLFPTLISMGIESRPSVTGPVNVVANVAAQTGFFIAPATVGVVADATTIETAMLLQVGLAVALVVVVVGLKLGPLAGQEPGSA